MKKLISIVLPVYNEEPVIPALCNRLETETKKISKYDFELIMVENGSFDSSYNLLLKERRKNKKIKIIQIVKNVGTDGALIAGLSFAKGDAAVVMMADLQEDPSLLPKFIKKWEKGFEIVYGIVGGRKKLPLLRQLETYLYYKIINLITNNLVIENASDFRLMDRKAYRAIVEMPEHNKFFRGLANWMGFRQIGVRFDRAPRYAGESKAYFSTVMKVALNGIFSFSNLPVYLPFALAAMIFIFSVGLLLLKQWQLAIDSLFFTFILGVLGIQAEYLRRILLETRNRPQFLIREKIGF